jgi:predicted TIM-barrel fold metal-dependent hydrolase
VGVDRLIFSVDYPYTDNGTARALLDTAPMSPSDREKFAHGTVERLLRLSCASSNLHQRTSQATSAVRRL